MDTTIRRISKADWQNSWMGVEVKIAPHAINFAKSKGSSRELHDGWQWYQGRQIRVFREPTVAPESVPPVIAGLRSLIERIGLDLRVLDLGAHQSIQPAIDHAAENKVIDGEKFGSYLVEDLLRDETMGGIPHADVLVTDRHLALGREYWGQSSFSQGYMIISLPGTRQKNQGFITNVAMHEAGHLLGLPMHHDTYLEDFAVEGYSEVDDCLMLWAASTREICPRCEDAIKYLWRGLQQGTLPAGLLEFVRQRLA
jgi:hypothetical protein